MTKRVFFDLVQKSVNPPKMSLSRPSTRERSQLSTREKSSRASSQRLTMLNEDGSSSDTACNPELRINGQGLEEEKITGEELEQRLTREKEERAQRLREKLEHSLTTSDAVRMRRRHLAEVYTCFQGHVKAFNAFRLFR